MTAMEEGIISQGDTVVDEGEFKKITPSPKCWIFTSGGGATHGSINVMQALAQSCNYFLNKDNPTNVYKNPMNI